MQKMPIARLELRAEPSVAAEVDGRIVCARWRSRRRQPCRRSTADFEPLPQMGDSAISFARQNAIKDRHCSPLCPRRRSARRRRKRVTLTSANRLIDSETLSDGNNQTATITFTLHALNSTSAADAETAMVKGDDRATAPTG